jgi:ATP-dependent Clp protease adaptor protein ClpS
MGTRVKLDSCQNTLEIKDMSNQVKFQEEVLLIEKLESQIILHDDDFNTFDWVIECLQKYCEHTELQAEQCAWVVHTKGKCNVKSGSLEKLIGISQALNDSGLSATIE